MDRSWGRDKDRNKRRDRNRVVDHRLLAVQATEYCSKGGTKTKYLGLERGDRDSDRNRDTNRDKEMVKIEDSMRARRCREKDRNRGRTWR